MNNNRRERILEQGESGTTGKEAKKGLHGRGI